jgi:hypothetical protein
MARVVEEEPPDYILQVPEAEYVNHIFDRFSIEPPALDFEGISATPHEEMIPSEYFPSDFFVARCEAYPKQVFTFYIPMSGSVDLLQFRPSTHILDTRAVYVQDGSLCFDIIDFHQDPNQIKGQKDQALQLFRQQLTRLQEDINSFNGRIRANASSLLQKRRAKLSKYEAIAKGVGVPIKKPSQFQPDFLVRSSCPNFAHAVTG